MKVESVIDFDVMESKSKQSNGRKYTTASGRSDSGCGDEVGGTFSGLHEEEKRVRKEKARKFRGSTSDSDSSAKIDLNQTEFRSKSDIESQSSLPPSNEIEIDDRIERVSKDDKRGSKISFGNSRKTKKTKKEKSQTQIQKEEPFQQLYQESYRDSQSDTWSDSFGIIVDPSQGEISDSVFDSSGEETLKNKERKYRLDRRLHRGANAINQKKRAITQTQRKTAKVEREISFIRGKIRQGEYKEKRFQEIIERTSGEEVKIGRFPDFGPVEGTKYFHTKAKKTPSGLAVVIPFFNEPSHELQQTLNSLYVAWTNLRNMSKKWENKELHLILIQDGWHKADFTMKEYIKTLFPKKYYVNGNYIDWWDFYPDFTEYDQGRDGNLTYVFERMGKKININPQRKYKDKNYMMNITLMVKINNRRKHNSHEWFMGRSGFAESVNAEYLFMTDAFTLFNPTCLYHLVTYMDKNAKYSAVTGRQRVMTRAQQGTYESIFSFKYMLRMVQLYDFELANAVYNGAFSLGGFLPVVPGPCGLYRASDALQNAARDWYFGVVNEEPDETGLVLGNLRIAEDRVLSYSSALKTREGKFMAFNPHAIFYFEAETELRNFVLQRRRWINGSVAGYIYLLFMAFSHFMGWKTSAVRKLYVWILLMCQLLIYASVAIAPAITIRILHFGITYLVEVGGNTMPSIAEWAIIISLWGIYITHVLIHHKNKFNYLVFFILTLISFATTIIGMTSLVYYLFFDTSDTIVESLIGDNFGISTNGVSGYPLYAGLAVIVCPFILAFMISGSGHSPLYMYKAFIPYMLFTHVMIAWFGSYSYARIWDLSWGNRPADQLNDLTTDQRDNMMKKFKNDSGIVLFFIILLNIGVFFIPFEGQIWIMAVLFSIALYQMFFSFLFLAYKIYEKLRFCCIRCRDGNIDEEDGEQDIIAELEDIRIDVRDSLSSGYSSSSSSSYSEVEI